MSVAAAAVSKMADEQDQAVPARPAANTAAGVAGQVLRILSGAHLGAEVPVRTERLLVGNLDTECDLVLDVGRTERHVCLLRISSDGWTVLGIAGDLWVGTDYVQAQQTRALSAGEPLTLGRVAFAVASAGAANWDLVRPPVELVRPEAGGPMPVAASLPTRAHVLRGWRALHLAAGLGIGALLVAAGIAYVTSVLQTQVPREVEAARRLEAARSALALLPIAGEVQVTADPDEPGRLQLRGYVPERAHLAELERALQATRAPVTLRVQPVVIMAAELRRRLAAAELSEATYAGQGVFEMTLRSQQLQTLDTTARALLQELPALAGFRVTVADLLETDGSNAVMTYRRAPERASDIVFDGADVLARTRRTYAVRDVRLGALPSVSLDNGARYFVGGRLPDGWTVQSITAEAVTLRHGTKETRLRTDASGAAGK